MTTMENKSRPQFSRADRLWNQLRAELDGVSDPKERGRILVDQYGIGLARYIRRYLRTVRGASIDDLELPVIVYTN